MTLTVEFDREEDGRGIALIDSIPGCHVYGKTRDEALVRVEALALHAIAERLSQWGHLAMGSGLLICDTMT